MNRLINFLIRWKLKRGTVAIAFPYYEFDYWLYEIQEEGFVELWVRRKNDNT